MLESVRDLCRFRVRALDGKVGKAADFYFDDSTWSIRYLVLNTTGWIFGHRVLIHPDCLGQPDGSVRVLPVSLTKEEVKSRGAIGHDEPISYQLEQLMMDRYGGSARWRGGGPMAPLHGAVSRQALAVAEADQVESTRVDSEAAHHLRSAQEVFGYQIEALDGPLGCLQDLLVGDGHWVIRYLLIDTKKASMPNPRVLIPASWVEHLSWGESRVHLRIRRDKIKHSPRYEPASHSHSRKPKPFLWP